MSNSAAWGYRVLVAHIGAWSVIAACGCAKEARSGPPVVVYAPTPTLSPPTATRPPEPAPQVAAQPQPTGEVARDDRLARWERAMTQWRERHAAVRAELASLDLSAFPEGHWAREWAGVYQTESGWHGPATVYLAPKNGLVAESDGVALGSTNFGDITETGADGITVALKIDASEWVWRGNVLAGRVHFVRWGHRKYLISEQQIADVLNTYHRTGSIEQAMFGLPWKLERGERTRASEGVFIDTENLDLTPSMRPDLPAKFAKLLTDEPVNLTVTMALAHEPEEFPAAESPWWTSGVVEFRGGETAGAFVGLVIMQQNKNGERRFIEIKDVKQDTCSGTFVIQSCTREPHLPRIGEVCSLGRGDSW